MQQDQGRRECAGRRDAALGLEQVGDSPQGQVEGRGHRGCTQVCDLRVTLPFQTEWGRAQQDRMHSVGLGRGSGPPGSRVEEGRRCGGVLFTALNSVGRGGAWLGTWGARITCAPSSSPSAAPRTPLGSTALGVSGPGLAGDLRSCTTFPSALSAEAQRQPPRTQPHFGAPPTSLRGQLWNQGAGCPGWPVLSQDTPLLGPAGGAAQLGSCSSRGPGPSSDATQGCGQGRPPPGLGFLPRPLGPDSGHPRLV